MADSYGLDAKTLQREAVALLAAYTLPRIGLRPSDALVARARRARDRRLDVARDYLSRPRYDLDS